MIIYIHHSDIYNDGKNQYDKINNYHKQKWNSRSSLNKYGGYTFLLDADNQIKQYRAVGEEQIAQKGYNTNSISICVAGNYEEQNLTELQKNKLKSYIQSLREQYGVSDITFHKEVGQTLCPGRNLITWIEREYHQSQPNAEEEKNQKKIKILQAMIQAYQSIIYLLKGGKK